MLNPKLPLLDLHRHLDGNIRPNTIWQLAQQNGIALPVKEFESFLPYVQIQENEPDLISFLKKLDWGVNVLASLDDCYRVAKENVEDAFKAGLDYAELRFSPYYMAMAHQLPVQGVVEAVIDAVKTTSNTLPIKTNLIGILSRTFGQEACQQELDGILACKDDMTAVDLAGDELNKPGELFTSHFAQVIKADLQVTVHAGEAAGSESIWQAINQLGATRIGHGVACQHDQKLMDFMKEHHIAIESCLTSNLQTGTVKNLFDHPVKLFLENDLLVCLNTDDPAVENIEIKDEFILASDIGLTDSHISTLQENAIQASFLSTNEKQELRNKNQFNRTTLIE